MFIAIDVRGENGAVRILTADFDSHRCPDWAAVWRVQTGRLIAISMALGAMIRSD